MPASAAKKGFNKRKRSNLRTVILLARTANTAIRVCIIAEVPQGYSRPFLEDEGLLGLFALGGGL